MDLLIALCQLAAFVTLGLGLALAQVRRIALWMLAGSAVLSVVHVLFGPETRTLETVHHYAGFEGAALEVSMVAFPTGTFTAPGWQWPLPFVAFALIWGAVLFSRGDREFKSPFLAPLLFAWSATATWLGMQAFAAPAAVVQTAGIDRFLWPACLALAILAARAASGLIPLMVMVSASMIAARLPAALFSKIASDQQLGTSLDISKVIDIVNPMRQMTFEPRLVSGSGAQQFWLIWLEHTIIYPALYTISLFGIALGVHLWHKHGGEED